ncbi:MAG: hypothetical protein HYU77_11425 [Betaproteobacteria bacterium]|nr:hypothetical protein [Betaproteobacteria bacterium]
MNGIGLPFVSLLRILAFASLAALTAGCKPSVDPPAPAATLAGEPAERFLAVHWSRPLQAQGSPPAGYAPSEASLNPADCGACHRTQHDDWSSSQHSRAMGPGVLGQLMDMPADALDQHQDCLRCHAPLKEQAESLAAALAALPRKMEAQAQKTAVPPLHAHGLACASCHLRGYRVYGPPRRDGSAPQSAAGFPHGGWSASGAFEDSRFCAACHQFEQGEYALNGKLLENTYEEWKASRHAREGRACQSCHMPERRHLWRGIHDPQMTNSGITVTAGPVTIESGQVAAELRIGNTGTGHYFPTYVTPRVIVSTRQESADGKVLETTTQEYVIGRTVALDLSRELSDTRLAPDEERVVGYRKALHPRAAHLAFEIRVEPDAFYTEFYRSLLESDGTGKGRALIRRALQDSLASRFVAYSRRQPLQP